MTEKEKEIHRNLQVAAQRVEAAHTVGFSSHKQISKCDCNIAIAWRNVISAMGKIEGIWE